MTIICGYADPARRVTWVGSDTDTFNGDIREPYGSKWTISGQWALGSSGDLRTNNLIRRQIHGLVSSGDPYEIAIALREALEEDGYERCDPQGAKSFGNHYLLASPGHLWSLGCDFSLVEISDFYADGCGRELGLGAWHAIKDQGLSGEQIVLAAIGAACAYHVNCGGRPAVHALRADRNLPVASAVLAKAA